MKETNTTVYEQSIKSLKLEINDLRKQQDRLHDLLERGIYDEETFTKRYKISPVDWVSCTKLSI